MDLGPWRYGLSVVAQICVCTSVHVTYCVISSSWKWNRTCQWLYYWYDVFTDQSWDFTRQHSCARCQLWATFTARTSPSECFPIFTALCYDNAVYAICYHQMSVCLSQASIVPKRLYMRLRQDALLPQVDRTTWFVSQNLANCCITV